MYRNYRGYWINSLISEFSEEQLQNVKRATVDGYTNYEESKYLYIYIKENQGVIHLSCSHADLDIRDACVDPDHFLFLCKLLSIDTALAMSACVETMKKHFEEESGGLG